MRLWDWQTGAQLERFVHSSERVASLQHSPRGDAILVAGDRGEVRLYAPWGELQTTLQGNGSPITQALFRPDGAAIATGSEDGSIRSWNRASGIEEWAVEDLPYGVGALAYTPYSRLLAGSAGEGPDSTIYLWDAESGEEVEQLSGHEDKVVDLAFSFDGTLLASASWDQTVRLWDVTSGEEIATLRGHTGRLTDLVFIPNGALVASIAEDYTLRLWDGASGVAIRELELPHTTPLAVAFSRDGRALLTTHDDGTIRTWLVDPEDTSTESKLLRAAAGVPRVTAEFTAAERRAYAIDTFVGAYALSASGNINIRPERLVQSLIVQPGSPDRVVALTNERFLLTSTDQGESWHIVTRLPLTLTYHSLGIPARVDDPLLVATDKGLYGLGDDGSISLVHRDALFGVSYSHTNPNELWAVRHDGIYKSEDAGATWGPAGNNLSTHRLHAPVLMALPNNNPQLVVGQPADHPARILWRGAANGFWEPLANVPALPLYLTDEQGIAWDAGNRILYLGGEWGELLAVENVDAPAAGDVTATAVEHFGPGTRVIPLAVGGGPSLYMSLLTPSGPKLLRGTWDGATWLWVELQLPIVALGERCLLL